VYNGNYNPVIVMYSTSGLSTLSNLSMVTCILTPYACITFGDLQLSFGLQICGKLHFYSVPALLWSSCLCFLALTPVSKDI